MPRPHATHGAPEKRFRFSNTCAKNGCTHWTGSKCGLIRALLDESDEFKKEELVKLPRCSIRPQCRWFRQEGARACAICPMIITDVEDT